MKLQLQLPCFLRCELTFKHDRPCVESQFPVSPLSTLSRARSEQDQDHTFCIDPWRLSNMEVLVTY